jgi:hypothetical protein
MVLPVFEVANGMLGQKDNFERGKEALWRSVLRLYV